jgi:hypothetical protein
MGKNDAVVIGKKVRNSQSPRYSEKPVEFDWLFSFPEVLKVYYHKRMEMKKGRSRSGLSFS